MWSHKQSQVKSASGAMPVDIAGFMKNKNTVAVFIDEDERRIEEEKYNFKY